MNSRLPLLALAGALTFASHAGAADSNRAIDTYLAITGLAPTPGTPTDEANRDTQRAAPLFAAAQAGYVDVRAVDAYLAITGLAPAAGELPPLSARVIALGGASAVVHYAYDPKGADEVRVVTTVRTGGDDTAAPARFVSHLSPGQKAEVSVASANGTDPAALEFAYDGGLLTVRPVTAQPED